MAPCKTRTREAVVLATTASCAFGIYAPVPIMTPLVVVARITVVEPFELTNQLSIESPLEPPIWISQSVLALPTLSVQLTPLPIKLSFVSVGKVIPSF